VNIVQGKKSSKKKSNLELDKDFEENDETFKERLEKIIKNIPKERNTK